MTVLEELDAGKKGLSESARNVRQVSRFLDELMKGATKKQIDRGLPLPSTVPINHGKPPPGGRVFFKRSNWNRFCRRACLAMERTTRSWPTLSHCSAYFPRPGDLGIQGHQPADQGGDRRRQGRGLLQDKTIEDADLLASGVQQLPPNFWEKHGKGIESWQQQSRTYYRVRGPLVREWQANQFVYDPGENGVEAIVCRFVFTNRP